MKLMLEVPVPEFQPKIQYQDKLFFIGSCFSNEMSNEYIYAGYDVLANPFGTVYNPTSILNQLQLILDPDFEIENYMVQHQGEWLSLLHNTSFRNKNKNKLAELIESKRKQAEEFLLQTSYCFITLGTSSVYRYQPSGLVVGNNQKLPATDFLEDQLHIEQISKDLNSAIQLLQKINPKIRCVLTISPVRYLRLGMIDNQRSKARLLLAVEALQKTVSFQYFPSYEIVLDELRDYRFFSSDFAHMNQLGIQYVWEKLSAASLDTKQVHIRNEILAFRKLQGHKVYNPTKQEAHVEILENKRRKIELEYGIKL